MNFLDWIFDLTFDNVLLCYRITLKGKKTLETSKFAYLSLLDRDDLSLVLRKPVFRVS